MSARKRAIEDVREVILRETNRMISAATAEKVVEAVLRDQELVAEAAARGRTEAAEYSGD